MEVRSGDVFWVKFDDESIGSEQHGVRPCVIVSNNVGNIHSSTVLAIPITSSQKSSLPTHVAIPADVGGLPLNSTILCENMAHISKERIQRYIGHMPKYFMKQIAIASTLATSMISYLDEVTLMQLHAKTIGLNYVKEERK